MFGKILHANDGSEHAFRALALALAIAKQNRSELHVVCVEEIPFLPEFMEEVRESAGTAARYFHGVLQRARGMAEQSQVHLDTHVLAGHPVRDIVTLAADLEADLLVIGATGHSAMYERMIGSRADRIIQLAQCPVLVVRPEGANHLWRENPPRELSIGLVADERPCRVTGRVGAS
jgi:nucleotide-binding universal stress UspA family protein